MKKLLFLYVIFGLFFRVDAQKAEYHWFEDGDKIYYNKYQPVYFWISTTPDDNSGDVLLTSRRSKKYTNPMYFDTEGYNTFQCAVVSDKDGRSGHLEFKVYVDGLPPVLSVNFQGVRYYRNGKLIYKKGLKIVLKAKDWMSGTDKIMYCLNGGAYKVYSSPLEFSEAGENVLRVYAVDNTGNRSKEKVFRFRVR